MKLTETQLRERSETLKRADEAKQRMFNEEQQRLRAAMEEDRRKQVAEDEALLQQQRTRSTPSPSLLTKEQEVANRREEEARDAAYAQSLFEEEQRKLAQFEADRRFALGEQQREAAAMGIREPLITAEHQPYQVSAKFS